MKKFILYKLLVFMVLAACTSNQPEESASARDIIEITKKQFQSENMELGSPFRMLFETKIHFTGKIVPQSDGMAKINAPIEGIVKNIHVQTGKYISTGETLIEIGGNILIDMQQTFAASSAKMKQLKADFERAKKLYDEKILTENAYMLAESNYKSELANYSALKMKLKSIGLNITDIENGIYTSTYKIKAPVNGQLVKFNCTLGQFITPQQDIAEIVNHQKIQLQLSVFEKDIPNIEPGQKVLFTVAGAQNQKSTATIKHVGKILDPNSKSSECYAEINTPGNGSFVINQLVNGDIIVKTDSVYAIPQNAIITSGKNSYVYAKESEREDGYTFRKIKVTTGRTDKDFIEIIDVPVTKLLISGTYNITIE